HDITLEDLLSTAPQRLRGRIGKADLVVVRTQDIDALGEGPSLYRARKLMTDVLGELKDAAQRLAGLGFQTLVFASDHGHVLVPAPSTKGCPCRNASCRWCCCAAPGWSRRGWSAG